MSIPKAWWNFAAVSCSIEPEVATGEDAFDYNIIHNRSPYD